MTNILTILWTIYLFSFFRFPITQTILICCHCPTKNSYFSYLSGFRWNQRGDLRCLCYISRVLLVLVYSRLFDGHHTVCSSPILYSTVAYEARWCCPSWSKYRLTWLQYFQTFSWVIHIAKRDEFELQTWKRSLLILQLKMLSYNVISPCLSNLVQFSQIV